MTQGIRQIKFDINNKRKEDILNNIRDLELKSSKMMLKIQTEKSNWRN